MVYRTVKRGLPENPLEIVRWSPSSQLPFTPGFPLPRLPEGNALICIFSTCFIWFDQMWSHPLVLLRSRFLAWPGHCASKRFEERFQLIFRGNIQTYPNILTYPLHHRGHLQGASSFITWSCLKTGYEPKAPAAECCHIGDELGRLRNRVQLRRQRSWMLAPVRRQS